MSSHKIFLLILNLKSLIKRQTNARFSALKWSEGEYQKHFSKVMSNSFRYQRFVAVSGNYGGKFPLVGDVLSSRKQRDFFPTRNLSYNLIRQKLLWVPFQSHRNNNVDLRKTFLDLLKFEKIVVTKLRRANTFKKNTGTKSKWLRKTKKREKMFRWIW